MHDEDQPGLDALLMAAVRSDVRAVTELLAEGVDANAHNDVTPSALYRAAENGCVEIAQLLLDAGAEVDARESMFGDTPLTKGASNGHVEVVELLLARGADPNARDTWAKQTALHQAVGNLHSAVVRVLLEHGADASLDDGEGATPLRQATEWVHTLSSRHLEPDDVPFLERAREIERLLREHGDVS